MNAYTHPVVPVKRVQSWEKNALNRLVHNLLEIDFQRVQPNDLAPKTQQPTCKFPGKQIQILFHNLYVD